VVPILSDLIWRKWNFICHSKFHRLNIFQDLSIGRIAAFSLDSIMYEGMGLAFNQEH
jgi:hypothetical protein